ncbi:bifunctional apoptosis regulator [Aplysia californica]|uniref:Bifunctional apoptosis regulator n=1 Tax=Aplysia californica TaxID=6500 RepID=A0ABM0JWV4_APLCA|nr:bifunctional apoptosis regulator [Aplysia californica]
MEPAAAYSQTGADDFTEDGDENRQEEEPSNSSCGGQEEDGAAAVTECRQSKGEDSSLMANGHSVEENRTDKETLSGETEENSSAPSTELRHREKTDSKFDADLENEFACPVCLRIVIQPTTLNCGHTSCRVCLARWYFNSKKKECPLCRKRYQGHPMINRQIKNLLESVFPDKIKEREQELEDDKDDLDVVKKYDFELSSHKSSPQKFSDITSFCSGIIVAMCAFVVVYLAWYWQTSDANLLVKKPVQMWKPKDVATWIGELGWAKVYAGAVTERQIDGTMLLSLDEETLSGLLNMTDSTHQKALIFAIRLLQDQGVKMPASLWEYKAIYPGRCLFLVYSMKDFPRTSLLYLWLYFHDEMFMPFLRATSCSTDLSLPANSTEDGVLVPPEVTTAEWVSFLFYTLVLPEWLVATFTFQMFDQHLFTPLFVLATAFLYTVLEILNWLLFFKEEGSSIFPIIKLYLKQLMSAFMFMVVWPVVPSLVCDALFYGALYISPVHASMEVYNKFRALNELR